MTGTDAASNICTLCTGRTVTAFEFDLVRSGSADKELVARSSAASSGPAKNQKTRESSPSKRLTRGRTRQADGNSIMSP